tara:strand:+ start:15842 stop:17035 length:1194 start_codon:yes stop_codon:yes gene_type:complete
MRLLFATIVLLLAGLLEAQVQDFRVMTYNLLNYNPNNIDDRHDEFRIIMNATLPDLLIVQEVDGQSAVQMFADSVLNFDSTTYSFGTFIDGPDSDVGLFYKTRIFRHVGVTHYATDLRDIVHHQLKTTLRAPATDTNQVLHIIGLHLKASSSSSDQAKRKSEVDSLNKVLQSIANEPVIVCGDFNIYSSNEAAYQALVTSGSGYLYDTINITGTWNYANYAQYHTQSPRTTRFNGGANGGLDDRFDLMLFSAPIAQDSIYSYNGDMEVFGNDGQHYNKALTDLPKHPTLSDTIIEALHYASDHLPLMASFYNGIPGLYVQENSYANQIRAYTKDGVLNIINETGEGFQYQVFDGVGRLVAKKDLAGNQTVNLKPGFWFLIVTDKGGEPVLREVVSSY